MEFVKGRAYETYNIKEIKTEHTEDVKVDEETEEDEEAPVDLIAQINKFFHAISSNVEMYINNQ